MMRVLVLGAGGFVGRHVTAALAAADWATPVAARRRAGGSGIVLDATDRTAVAAAVASVDAVVNCVAGGEDVILANADALAEAAADRRIVHLSSMAVYGSAIGAIAEDAPLLSDIGAYGSAKVAAEQRLMAAGNVAILRPGCIYGRGSAQWSDRIAALLRDRRIGDLGAGGDGCSNLVHVDDVVAAVLAALRMPASGGCAYNLAMPDAPDWNGYFLALARAIDAVPIRRVPGWRMKLETTLLAPPLKIAERPGLALPPPIPPSLARLWRQDIRLISARATAELGIAWTSLAAGIDLPRTSA